MTARTAQPDRARGRPRDRGSAGPGVARAGGRVVLLAGRGDATHVVYHYLAALFDDVVAVVEDPPSRLTLAHRRARRLGWRQAFGQVAFVVLGMPVLRWVARNRIATILADAGLDATPIETLRRVPSVNDPETIEVLRRLDPSVVVVNGTRIIARDVLEAIGCPVVNIHTGITPTYRGVHGGYWALVEGRPDLAGVTVHLVDPGIDTGDVLAQGAFEPGPGDSIVTYPYLQLARGLPLLSAQVERCLAGRPLAPQSTDLTTGESQLRWHPTLWGYVARRVRLGVR